MPVPERSGAELAVGASRVGDRRGHRWEPVGHEVVIRRDHFGLGQRGAGDERGSGKKQTGELWHTGAPFAMSVEKATAVSARWRDVGAQYAPPLPISTARARRLAPSAVAFGGFTSIGGGVTDYRYPESHVFYRKLGRRYPRIVRGEGCWLYDERGKGYLDAVGGAYVANLGHSNPEMAESLARQAGEFGYVSATAFTHGPVEELARELAATLPRGLDKLYFLSSGSEAVEAALKLARQYWIEAGKPGKHHIIALNPSYHGNTLLTLSASSREQYKLPFPEWRGARGRDRARGRRHGRRVHRGAGRRLVHRGVHAAPRILPDDPRNLRPARRALRGRRDPVRGGPDRQLVGDRAVWRRPRPHDVGQGDLGRLRRAVGGGRARADRRRDRERLGEPAARPDLLVSPRRVRGRTRRGSAAQARPPRRAVRQARRSPATPPRYPRRAAPCGRRAGAWAARGDRVRGRQGHPRPVPTGGEVRRGVHRGGP